MFWLTIAATAFLLAGIALLIAGIRGRRINDHPICRACGFDLLGLSAGASPCPECGMALDQPNAVRIGERRRRRGAIAIGALLLLLGAGAIAAGSWGKTRGVNWNTYKPTWMLVAQADGWLGQADTPVLDELTLRSLDGSLEDSWLRTLATRAAVTRDTPKPWNQAWEELFMMAHRRNLITDEDRRRFLHGSLDVQAAARSRIRRGIPTRVSLSTWPQLKAGPILGNACSAEFELNTANSTPMVFRGTFERHDNERRDLSEPLDKRDLGFFTSFDVSPGEYVLKCRFTLELTFDTASDHTWKVDFADQRVLEVTASDEPSVSLEVDDAATRMVQDNCFLHVAATPSAEHPFGALRLSVPYLDLPFAYVMEAVIRDRHGVGGATITRYPMKPEERYVVIPLKDSDQPSSVDVVFLRNIDTAEGTLTITRIWDGAIVYEGIVLSQAGDISFRPSRIVSPAPQNPEELFRKD